MAQKIAIVLFNLGGPDSLDAVKPFLFNLFNDPSIIDLPWLARLPLAKFIAARRTPIAQEIYRQLGGSSPLLKNTLAQAQALESNFGTSKSVRCFVAMRYWRPRAEKTVLEVKAFAPDRIILLPLYPQYSGTTTGSSILDWNRAADQVELDAPTVTICCYSDNAGFITAMADRVGTALQADEFNGKRPRVLFTAHGLPQKIVDRGDPYQWHVERTARAIVDRLSDDNLDWQICYQSRVGRLVWLRPYTEDALKQAGQDGVPVIMVPVAFTSEHSETLVELDIEYRQLADESGVPHYVRVDTVGADSTYIDGLASLVRQAVEGLDGLTCGDGARCCPNELTGCAFARLVAGP